MFRVSCEHYSLRVTIRHDVVLAHYHLMHFFVKNVLRIVLKWCILRCVQIAFQFPQIQGNIWGSIARPLPLSILICSEIVLNGLSILPPKTQKPPFGGLCGLRRTYRIATSSRRLHYREMKFSSSSSLLRNQVVAFLTLFRSLLVPLDITAPFIRQRSANLPVS